MLKLTLMLAALVSPAAAFAGEIYRWTDASGNVHFSDHANSTAKKVDVRPTRPLPAPRYGVKRRSKAAGSSTGQPGVTRIISRSRHE